jgi:hypothetical protein
MMQKAFIGFFAKPVKEMVRTTGYTIATTVIGTTAYNLGMTVSEKTKEAYTKLNHQEQQQPDKQDTHNEMKP